MLGVSWDKGSVLAETPKLAYVASMTSMVGA
uniref:Uncharacterized protein n=1 Tax=Arundo donax TaxID=35708 RepID=A0A0A9AJY0_ARUDO